MLFPNSVLGNRYKLVDLIDRGGMGEVWVGLDTMLNRQVAIKTINNRFFKNNPAAPKAFYDEAKTGASLIGHPNIVTVLDYGTEIDGANEDHFLVMEFIEGINLDSFINELKPNIDEETYYNISLYIAWELCRAVEHAHSKSILHRDIKPLNIFLSDLGIAKVGDFGLARYIDAITRTHTVYKFKSPAYAAPEQWNGDKHVKATDFYQLGCTLYHLFTGKIPFDKANSLSLMNAHVTEVPEDPKIISNFISNEISSAILKLMSKTAKDRGALWMVQNILAKELQTNFKIVLDVSSESEELQKRVNEVTKFQMSVLKTKPFHFTYSDFSEAMSETIQLILIGCRVLTIKRLSNLGSVDSTGESA